MNMTKYDQIPSQEIINKTAGALRGNGIEVFVVENAATAKQKALELLPQGVEVVTMSSLTLETTGIAKEINESGKYNLVRDKFKDEKISAQDKRKYGAGPEFALGSVHIFESLVIKLGSESRRGLGFLRIALLPFQDFAG